MTDTVSFNRAGISPDLLTKIVDRAIDHFEGEIDRAEEALHIRMNLVACHANGNPLDFKRLYEADSFNFFHDIVGIDRHICRETDKLLNHFRPGFSLKKAPA